MGGDFLFFALDPSYISRNGRFRLLAKGVFMAQRGYNSYAIEDSPIQWRAGIVLQASSSYTVREE
jgi:hypothetical protein